MPKIHILYHETVSMRHVHFLLMVCLTASVSISTVLAFTQISNENSTNDDNAIGDLIPSENLPVDAVAISNELLEAEDILEDVMIKNSSHPISSVFDDITMSLVLIEPRGPDNVNTLIVGILPAFEDRRDEVATALKEHFGDIQYEVALAWYTPLSPQSLLQ